MTLDSLKEAHHFPLGLDNEDHVDRWFLRNGKFMREFSVSPNRKNPAKSKLQAMWSRTKKHVFEPDYRVHPRKTTRLQNPKMGLHYAYTAPAPKSRSKCSFPFCR